MSNQNRKRPPTRRLRPLALGLWLTAAPGWTVAAESLIELRDATVLRGELISVEGGAYRIRTRSMGEISIPESEVVALRPLGAGTGGEPVATPLGGSAQLGQDHGSELAAIQQQLAGDPDTMQAIMALQADPEIRAALADPALVQLILSGNVEALGADPRFKRLMEHPAIQAIVGGMTGR